MAKILVTEALAQAGIDLMRETHEVTVALKPSSQELVGMIGDYDALIVRSATQVTSEVIEAASKLQIIGRAGTGVDNIDLDAATHSGVIVVNAPTSNTVAVAEHTMALMLALARHIPQADTTTHEGKWEKRALMGTELRDKILGLVGLGRVGRNVAARAQSFEMRILAYDPFATPETAARLNVELVEFDELLKTADYVSVHAPSTSKTRGMINAEALAMMKPTAKLINCARGDLVVSDALCAALHGGTIAAAALDVFPEEPHIDGALLRCPNLVLTPHLGASTEEAQSNAAVQVARQIVGVLDGRPARYPVNVTALSPSEMERLEPYLDLARRMGRFYAQLTDNHLRRIEMVYAGDTAELNTTWITSAMLSGLLTEAGHEYVNMVNARLVAEEQGLALQETRTTDVEGFAGLITLHTVTSDREHTLSGTMMRGEPRIVRVEDNWLEFVPKGYLLVDEHRDTPGLFGKIGTVLGNNGINIGFAQLGRASRGAMAVMVLSADDPIGPEVLRQVRQIKSLHAARFINLS